MGWGSSFGSALRKAAKNVSNAAVDAVGSVQKDPTSLATLSLAPAQGVAASYYTGRRAVQDMKDQAAGMAQTEQERADAAAAYAKTLIPQAADVAEVRRQRLRQYAIARGTTGTVANLGTPSGAKTLLGL